MQSPPFAFAEMLPDPRTNNLGCQCRSNCDNRLPQVTSLFYPRGSERWISTTPLQPISLLPLRFGAFEFIARYGPAACWRSNGTVWVQPSPLPPTAPCYSGGE